MMSILVFVFRIIFFLIFFKEFENYLFQLHKFIIWLSIYFKHNINKTR